MAKDRRSAALAAHLRDRQALDICFVSALLRRFCRTNYTTINPACTSHTSRACGVMFKQAARCLAATGQLSELLLRSRALGADEIRHSGSQPATKPTQIKLQRVPLGALSIA